jgi:chromosome segregation ATPase
MKLEKVDDKTAYENLLVKYAELESKIADIKANCDLAIEGRDVKIKELEEENNKYLDVISNYEVKVADLEKQIEKMKTDVKREQSFWNSCEMQYDLYQRLLDKWGKK